MDKKVDVFKQPSGLCAIEGVPFEEKTENESAGRRALQRRLPQNQADGLQPSARVPRN